MGPDHWKKQGGLKDWDFQPYTQPLGRGEGIKVKLITNDQGFNQ